jgi:hypothetical protein
VGDDGSGCGSEFGSLGVASLWYFVSIARPLPHLPLSVLHRPLPLFVTVTSFGAFSVGPIVVAFTGSAWIVFRVSVRPQMQLLRGRLVAVG